MDKIVVANLKMNLSYDEIINYNDIISKSDIDVIVAPSNIYLSLLSKNKKVLLCAQNGYYKDKGAYTGEVSFKQLKSIGVKYCLIGHSERRHIFKESNEEISLKVDACILNNIIPILCIGETLEEKKQGITFNVLKDQIDSALKDKSICKIIIAYEPVWSIGTGMIPSNEDIESTHSYINELVSKYVNDFRILYGGSVNCENINNICMINGVDGVLIGGASLDPSNLISMTKNVNK